MNQYISRRDFLKAAGLSAAALSLTACGSTAASSSASSAVSGSASAGSAAGGTDLIYWSMWNSTEPQAVVIQEAIDAYQKKTGNTVTVEWKGRDINTLIQAALDAGEKIDLFDEDYQRIGTQYAASCMDLESMAKAADYDSFAVAALPTAVRRLPTSRTLPAFTTTRPSLPRPASRRNPPPMPSCSTPAKRSRPPAMRLWHRTTRMCATPMALWPHATWGRRLSPPWSRTAHGAPATAR